MSINVRNPEAEYLVDELKRRTGKDTTDLLLDLLRREQARLDEGVGQRIAIGLDADRRLRETWDSLLIVDPRPIDEIVAYDENGLPA